MALRVLIIAYRKPGLTPDEFRTRYEAHAMLIKRLAGDTFPISHRRTYITRTTVHSPLAGGWRYHLAEPDHSSNYASRHAIGCGL
jgi:hypothetical protein